MSVTPTFLNETILLAFGSPLGMVCTIFFLIAFMLALTWKVRGLFDKVMPRKEYYETREKDRNEDKRVQEEMVRIVQSNGLRAVQEVKTAGIHLIEQHATQYREILDKTARDHMETAERLRDASEELDGVAKATAKNTETVARLAGAVETLVKLQERQSGGPRSAVGG